MTSKPANTSMSQMGRRLLNRHNRFSVQKSHTRIARRIYTNYSRSAALSHVIQRRWTPTTGTPYQSKVSLPYATPIIPQADHASGSPSMPSTTQGNVPSISRQSVPTPRIVQRKSATPQADKPLVSGVRLPDRASGSTTSPITQQLTMPSQSAMRVQRSMVDSAPVRDAMRSTSAQYSAKSLVQRSTDNPTTEPVRTPQPIVDQSLPAQATPIMRSSDMSSSAGDAVPTVQLKSVARPTPSTDVINIAKPSPTVSDTQNTIVRRRRANASPSIELPIQSPITQTNTKTKTVRRKSQSTPVVSEPIPTIQRTTVQKPLTVKGNAPSDSVARTALPPAPTPTPNVPVSSERPVVNNSKVIIQRQSDADTAMDTSAMNNSAPTSMPPDTASMDTSGAGNETNVDEIVDKVWQKLMRWIAVEGERRGRKPWL